VTTQGQLLSVWQDAWLHVWVPLAREATRLNHPDLFCELYPELNRVLLAPKSIEEVARITDDVDRARRQFRKTKVQELRGEGEVIAFVEECYEVLENLGGQEMAEAYFVLLDRFLSRFSLRYDLARPCTLRPTLPGVFVSLMCELRALTGRDAHLDGLMKDFENAVGDLRGDRSDTRIKTCIQKQMNLLEAIGRQCPGVTGITLGAICNQVGTWPHDKVKQAMAALYGFASDYPGIRHGGTPANALRAIQMRDMVAMSILLAGFTPYLSDQFDAEAVYLGG
jgi:hypothetical protein